MNNKRKNQKLDSMISLAKKIEKGQFSKEEILKLIKNADFAMLFDFDSGVFKRIIKIENEFIQIMVDWEAINSLDRMVYRIGVKSPHLAYILALLNYECSKSFNDERLICVCANTLGTLNRKLKNMDESIGFYKEALKIAVKILDDKSQIIIMQNLALTYSELGNYEKSRDCQLKALAIAKKIKDKESECKLLNGLGNSCFCQGELHGALNFYQRAVQLAKEIGDQVTLNILLNNMGNINRDLGNFQVAFNYYERALDIAENIDDKRNKGLCINNLGLLYYLVGNYTEAISLFKQAQEIAREIGDKQGENNSIGNLGLVYIKLNDFYHAITYLKQALKLSKETGIRRDESIWLANLGAVYYISLGNLDQAIDYLQGALTISTEIGDEQNKGTCLANLGNIFCVFQNYDKAMDYFQQALSTYQKIGSIPGEEKTYYILGDLYENQFGELQRAYDCFRQSIELSEKIQIGVSQEEHKRGLISQAEHIYERMVSLCIKIEKFNEAFEFAEKIKYRTFLDLLSTVEIEPSDIEKCLSLKQIKENLTAQKENITLIEYFLTDKQIFIFIIRSDDLNLHIEKVNLSIHDLFYYLDTFKQAINEFEQGVLDFYTSEFNQQNWESLSHYFITPIIDYIKKDDLIYFIPHRLLHYLPLHALKYEGQYLIERNPVAYAPSASIIPYCQKKRKGKCETCLVLGDSLGTKGHDNLTYSKKEAVIIADLYDTKAYLHEEANKATVKRILQNNDIDIIHFSCHGKFEQDQVVESGIELSDGRLTIKEISNLHLNADLVNLSICESGINKRNPGDELIGLTRSFIHAGTSSVMVSLWQICDESTSILMRDFYTRLRTGESKSEALRNAVLALIKTEKRNENNQPIYGLDGKPEKYNHPYYWASFILVGDYK